MADNDALASRTLQVDPAVEIAELQLRMQSQIDFLTNRVLVLAQLLRNSDAALAEAAQLMESAGIKPGDAV